ncbi:predicted protein [Chaetomium globosum CBS 148.51]|uniref:Uncharacterized protein n=1 Tax=Chaetomium globosum (strain ATCC 6205 / CBS 148.51 / DSM 1962 / NBRC 6347 / NRRL 1970) TaxID=306901 RepID=Q2H4U0_CHAGB|nr:uncharacterized protein CHGG_06325 [Chaetomium globosum CBS 148.51]EAQ89706.1 predicted protein [Chaetomium globosum CBS 148.51]
MASSHHNAQLAEEPIEPDDDIPATVDDHQYYGTQRPPYWYRICPGGFLIPPPLPPSSEQHHGVPPAQGPPVDGVLVHAQPVSDQHHQAPRDAQPRGISQEPTSWESRTGATNTHQPPEPTPASQGSTTALRPNSEPQSQDRQRCDLASHEAQVNSQGVSQQWPPPFSAAPISADRNMPAS